ncbi:hypothetical protein M1506_03480 [Patescibacteria group bacterium]|nr:hypothetical protein [Patescibacteria group bacterium]
MFETRQIKKLEEEANVNIECILGETKNIFGEVDTYDWKKDIDKIRLQYVALKERFKHNKKELLELAIDWQDSTDLLSKSKTLYSMVCDALDEKALEANDEVIVRIQEIEKKFSRLLE